VANRSLALVLLMFEFNFSDPGVEITDSFIICLTPRASRRYHDCSILGSRKRNIYPEVNLFSVTLQPPSVTSLCWIKFNTFFKALWKNKCPVNQYVKKVRYIQLQQPYAQRRFLLFVELSVGINLNLSVTAPIFI